MCGLICFIVDDGSSSLDLKEKRKMKKLMTLMLGMSLAFTTVAVCFADDAPKTEKKSGKKKGGKKKTDMPKKDGGK